MNKNFVVIISATDKATAVIRKINAGISQATRPFQNLQRAAGNFSKAAGLDKLAKSVVNVGRAAFGVAEKLAGMAASVGAIIGLGSVTAIAALADQWARLGDEIGRTSLTLGVGVSQLQSLRGVAKALGLDMSSVDSGLKSIGDTMEDALFGRNQQALIILNRLGVRIHRNRDGVIDSTRAFMDLSSAISRIKSPQVQGLVARQFGVEALLPMLRKGPAAIADYQKEVARLGGVMSDNAVRAAGDFSEKLNFLQISIGGVKNTIADKLIPVFQPLITKTTEWFAANRELIGTKVAAFAQGIADALMKIDLNKLVDGIGKTIDKIGDFVDAMGGWKNVAIATAIVMNGSLIASLIDLGLAVIPRVITMFGLMSLAATASIAKAGSALAVANLGAAAGWGALGFASVAVGLGAAGVAGYGIGSLFNALGGEEWLASKFGNYNGKNDVVTPFRTPLVRNQGGTDTHAKVDVTVKAHPGTAATVRTNGVPVRVSNAMAFDVP